jgi:asparagine synthase (glutamine-hydrolysing)
VSAPRYLLLLAQPGTDCRSLASDLASATGLVPVEPPRGALLLCSSPSLAIFVSSTGAIVGHLFDKRRPTSVRHEDLVNAGVDFDTLLSNYWGAYIAVRRGLIGDEILRDPSGALPCYRVTAAGHTAFSSDPQTLCDAGLLLPEIDHIALSRHLLGAGLPSQRTVLKGLGEVPPGFRFATNTGTAEALWSPWRFATARPMIESRTIEEQLQRTVQNCVSAWAAPHHRILIGVSGGLDSSIVTACLTRTKSHVIAATLATRDPEGDERRFARILADSLAIELIEADYRHEHIDITRSAAAHLPRPSARTQILAHDAAMLEIVRDRSIDAFFSGNGGDNVFCLLQSARPLVDRLLTSGPGPAAFHVLLDICRMTGCSPLQALRLAAGPLWSGERGYRWKGDRSFLSRYALAMANAPLDHPWLATPTDALPGKSAHIAMLLRAQMTLEGFDRHLGPITVSPLISQPIVELCLQIPSWQWCAGGLNRAVARQAFARQLPDRIVERRHKGGPDGFSVEILERNRARIAERLLNGRMVREGLLDRHALADALRDRGPTHGVERVRILALLDTEAWLDHWTGMRSSMLAAPHDDRNRFAIRPSG